VTLLDISSWGQVEPRSSSIVWLLSHLTPHQRILLQPPREQSQVRGLCCTCIPNTCCPKAASALPYPQARAAGTPWHGTAQPFLWVLFYCPEHLPISDSFRLLRISSASSPCSALTPVFMPPNDRPRMTSDRLWRKERSRAWALPPEAVTQCHHLGAFNTKIHLPAPRLEPKMKARQACTGGDSLSVLARPDLCVHVLVPLMGTPSG
jgi:hypothetical protein